MNNMLSKTCCFSGHRIIPKDEYDDLRRKTECIILDQIKKGYTVFKAGGALGFDMMCAKIVIELKKAFKNIELILVLPCLSQTKNWSEKDKNDYESIKENADKVIYTSEVYYKGCMQKRNRSLVDGSGLCICFLKKNTGGTAYTVKYAVKRGLTIINVV